MESLTNIKTSIFATIGVLGSIITGLLVVCDTALQTLLIFMVIDYILGLIVAGVFHKSNKTETGTLESLAGWKGICKKVVTLLMVLVGTQLDKITSADYVRYGIIIAFIVNELISITENAGLMGLPIPQLLINAIDILKKQKPTEKEVKE